VRVEPGDAGSVECSKRKLERTVEVMKGEAERCPMFIGMLGTVGSAAFRLLDG